MQMCDSLESMVVLRRQPKDPHTASHKLSGIRRSVLLPEESLNGELPPLDPELLGLGDGVEAHESAVCARDESGGVGGLGDGSGGGLKLSVEELVASGRDAIVG